MLHNYSALIYTGCLNNIYIYIYLLYVRNKQAAEQIT